MKVILIGYRGTGKSVVAQQVALRLGWECWDSDREVERHHGRSIVQIFQDMGEFGFRDLETQMLSWLCHKNDNIILATGGGAILRTENRQLLSKSGTVVWLVACSETIFQRITSDLQTVRDRPHLTNMSRLNEIEQLLSERAPFYEQCADFKVDTEDKTIVEVAQEIVTHVNLTSDP